MAVIPLKLYARFVPGEPVDGTHNRLLFNQLGGSPSIPALVAGDTLDVQAFFLDQGTDAAVPYRFHRYTASTVVVRLRAQGNNTIYATGSSGAEITPATGFARAVTQLHSTGVEKHRAIINSLPVTGTYKVKFPYKSSSGGVYISNKSSGPIHWNASADTILEAIRTIKGYYSEFGGPLTYPDVYYRFFQKYGHDWGTSPFVTGDASDPVNGFTLAYGQGLNGNSYWADMPLFEIDDADLNYAYGWSLSVPLNGNGNTFSDLYLANNGPAYLEVLINGGLVAQYLLPSAGEEDPGEPPDPLPPPGGGPPSGGPIIDTTGIYFNVGNLITPFAIEDVRISNGITRDSTSLVYRQRYAQFRYHWLPLARGQKNCPHDPNAVCVDEGQPEDIGAYIRVWERVWAVKPAPRTEPGDTVKIFKEYLVRVDPPDAGHPAHWVNLSTATVIPRSRSVKADYEYTYFNPVTEGIPALPDTPDVAVVNVGGHIWLQPYGGFNPSMYGGTNYGGNNFARCLVSAQLREYLGFFVERLLIYA